MLASTDKEKNVHKKMIGEIKMSFKKLMVALLIVTMVLSLLTFNVSAEVPLQASTDNPW